MLDNTLSKVVYVADGIQKQWDIPFEFYKIEDVHIYITSDGEHIEEIDQNYYYDEEGKFFIYPTEESELDPIPAGTQVLILRETENTQLEDSSEIYFKSKDIERGLDNLTMQVQDLKRDSLRAVKLSHFATQTPEDFTKGIFEAEKRATEAAANASLSEQNAASSESSAVQAGASATASAELAQSAANNGLQYAERAENAAAGSAASAASAAESASLAQDVLNQFDGNFYSKPEIDAKVSGLQAEIDLVESYIPSGTNDVNTLVNKQQLLDEEMDMRSDFNESVSELQTQITAQASAIANKVDVTGDTMTGALNLPELNVSTSEGTLNLSITAGVATIATNNGLDIVSQTKFDTAPTTDDSTTWADALDTSLVRKAQVAAAIAAGGGGSVEIPDNVYTAENLVAGDNITFTPPKAVLNADIVGSPVVSDNYEVSGFSDSNYLKFVDPIASASQYDSFEIGFAFKANTLNTENAGIYDSGSIDSPGYRITINQQNVRVRIITTSSGDYGIDITGATTLATNKKYYAKVNYSSGTGYTLSLKEEGGEWVVDASTTTTTKPYPNGREVLLGDNKATGASFDGTIYLPEMYIDIDGKRVWTGLSISDKTIVSADNVYTKTNLLGGKDIEIIPEPVEGGIDEYTLSCFHLDGTAVDEVTGYTLSPTMDNSVHKFGTGSSMWTPSTNFPWSLNNYESFSFDYWYYHKTSRSSYWGLRKSAYFTYLLGLSFQSGATKPNFYILSNKHSIDVDFEQNKWTHVYVYYNAEDRSFHLFVNGREVFSAINSTDFSGVKEFSNDGYTESRIDEIRISKCIRWTEDFEPPTQPYTKAEPTGNQVINFTGTIPSKTSELENDSGFITADDIPSTGGAFDFQGTEEEFNAAVEAGEITDDTVSLVTDDNSGELVATKAELTAVDASKADTALSNVLANIDYVVDSKEPTEEDPTWYRKYKSGWLEQGGYVLKGTNTVSLIKPFINTNYTITTGGVYAISGNMYSPVINTQTTVSFVLHVASNYTGAYWEAKGQGAE